MATKRMTIELAGEQRSDGSYHLKSPDYPGFHFIVGADEQLADFEGPLNDALKAFLPQYFTAQARRQQEQASAAFRIMETRPRLNFRVELEFA